jgi:hypothetical protein
MKNKPVETIVKHNDNVNNEKIENNSINENFVDCLMELSNEMKSNTTTILTSDNNNNKTNDIINLPEEIILNNNSEKILINNINENEMDELSIESTYTTIKYYDNNDAHIIKNLLQIDKPVYCAPGKRFYKKCCNKCKIDFVEMNKEKDLNKFKPSIKKPIMSCNICCFGYCFTCYVEGLNEK